MTFAEFKIWREECLRANPHLLDCGETNLYRALSHLQPKPQIRPNQVHIHRCDLARKWLSRYGLPEADSRRAYVCRGVRHGLRLISNEISASNAVLYAPRDVYPVYLEIAQSAGVEVKTFATLPAPVLPTAEDASRFEYLLICNPWKPLGRFLTADECEELLKWVSATNKRCIIIDSVYDLGAPFHHSTMSLAATGRVILLHSVTKGWLWPQTFGIAWAGTECLQLDAPFRKDSPSQDQLALADRLLSDSADLPSKVTAILNIRKNKLLDALPQEVVPLRFGESASAAPGCYFFPTRATPDELLKNHGILGIPASVFGADWSGTILTSLAPVFAKCPAETAYEST